MKMKRLAAALLTFIMLLIAQTALAGGDAIVDDFTARMVIGIDGSLSVEETITYSVTDSINGFTRDIDPSFGSGYSDFSAARIIDGSEIAMRYDESAARGDEGVYYAEQQDNGLVRYYMFVPCGEGDEVTMVYRYRLEDVCKRYLDVGVLDMPLLGDAWEMDIDSYTGRIEFIGQVEGNIDMLVKSAGMNLTECAVTDGGIDFAGEDAGSGGVFRVRLMFPSGALSGMAYTREENMRGRILADEAEYQAALEESDRMGKIVLLCAIIVMAAAIAAACLIWDRDPRVDAYTYTTGAPLPVRGDIGPAEVKVIFSGSLPDTNTLAAVMLDLTRRGYIDIVGGKGDMEYVRTAKSIDDCSDQEQFVLNWIMNIGDGESVTLDAVRKAAAKIGLQPEIHGLDQDGAAQCECGRLVCKAYGGSDSRGRNTAGYGGCGDTDRAFVYGERGAVCHTGHVHAVFVHAACDWRPCGAGCAEAHLRGRARMRRVEVGEEVDKERLGRKRPLDRHRAVGRTDGICIAAGRE